LAQKPDQGPISIIINNMKNIQERKKEDTRIMDSFIKKAGLFIALVLLFPAYGVLAQNQDHMKKGSSRSDTAKSTKSNKYSRTPDTARTYRYNQDMNMQNQNQNQQNRNRYDNQKGDTLQKDHSRDAVLIENNPRK
jgi:hypothetical protein